MLDQFPSLRRRAYLRAVAGTVSLPLVTGAVEAQSYAPLGSVPIAGAKEAVVDENNTVYVAATTGFAVVDVSTPSHPSIIAERRDILADEPEGPLKSIADVKVDGDRLLVAGPAYPNYPKKRDYFGAIAVYDVSDPSRPGLLRWKETEMYHHNVFIRDGIIYLTGNGLPTHPLVMVDSETLEELGRWSLIDVEPKWKQVPSRLWFLHDLWVQAGVAYLAYWDAGTWMVDVSDPAHPTLITKVRGRPPAEFMDLTEKEEIRTEYLEPPGNDHSVTTNDDATLLAIGEESGDLPPTEPPDQAGPGGIELFDISDPMQPKSRSYIEPPSVDTDQWTTVHNYEIVGDRLYSSWYAGGVRLFDVSDPANPTEIRSWRNSTSSFWAARAVRPGEFFIGSSRGDQNEETALKEDGRLFTFPDPPLENKPETPTKTQTPTQTTTTTKQPTQPATAPPTTAPTAGSPRKGTDASGPGFGIVAAAIALGGSAWHYLRTER